MPIGDRGDSTKEHYNPDTGDWSDDFFEEDSSLDESNTQDQETESAFSSAIQGVKSLFNSRKD